ncbi:MAG: GNAT family N-acetyltransferase [Fusobacterium varium]|uniref:GNAT family N-acetyltransferase n=1 Tax=Fusobacterium varium TaxID=856 RepID=UPI00242ECB08|nr:GNAT family N-acetyltransferase [Fusobacterium varium]MCI6031285.1 GNAT family N-acetyltransferase [Fusobacterium varium]MDY4005573.1 GNAT family N-acetyltransferase [Fusobacterium varium]
MIFRAGKMHYEELEEIWERSVRATHNFLTEKDIASIKKEIPLYFNGVEIYCTKNNDEKITGFIGIAEKKIEMLFIDPEHFRESLGKSLVKYVLENKGIDEVDVNEQNEKALKFYQYMGFEVVSRDEFDSMGNPFPILHMKIKKMV